MDKISFEKTKELYDFLRGKIEKFDKITTSEKLTEKQAFSVIYILQEAKSFGFIPDSYEMCNECFELFNIEAEGGNTENLVESIFNDIIDANQIDISDKLYKNISDNIESVIGFVTVCDCSLRKYEHKIEHAIYNQLKFNGIDVKES